MAITHPSVKAPGQQLFAVADWNASHVIDGNTGEILFREAGGTIGTSANLFWNNAAGRLGVRTNAPTTDLNVQGAIAGRLVNLVVDTDNYDVSHAFAILANATAGNITIGGLSGGVNGQILFIFKITSANNVIIEHNEAAGTQKFVTKDASDITLSTYGGVTCIFGNNNWYIIDS